MVGASYETPGEILAASQDVQDRGHDCQEQPGNASVQVRVATEA